LKVISGTVNSFIVCISKTQRVPYSVRSRLRRSHVVCEQLFLLTGRTSVLLSTVC